MPSIPHSDFVARFWARIDQSQGPAACWLWQGARSKGPKFAYGHVLYQGHNIKAHRIAWELTNGPIPPGVFVLHHCDVPLCCNPTHLFLGDQSTNMQDRATKGRHNAPYGERHGRAKLTDLQVQEIRRLYARGGVTYVALGRQFGVSPAMICDIVLGQSWRHLLP